MALFQTGMFTLASGRSQHWKIECDALDAGDWKTLAMILAPRLNAFGSVEGVPTGGAPLAEALAAWVTEGPVLIVDDVWTTGGSMRAHRGDREAIGAVVFATSPVDPWVLPLFTMAP